MRNGRSGEELGRPPLGAPIYGACPLLSAERRFIEDPDVTAACTERVAHLGGPDFFARPDAAAMLRRLHASRSSANPGRFADPAEMRALVTSELEQSRDLFRRFMGYAPRFLAYPWMMGSQLSLELARDFGFRCIFGVALDYARARRPNLPVRAFGRLKADWLRLLPGSGRSSFLKIAAGKIAGISATRHLAH